MGRLLCFLGLHDWGLEFYDGTLNWYVECKRCHKRDKAENHM
jgi:hypothetical protein